MMSMERPNHSGVEAGLVKKVKGTEASVLLTEDLYPQDVVEFRRDGTACYEYTRGEGAARGTMITARFKPGSDIRPGDRLYRTRRNELLDRIRTDWLEKDRQLPVRGVLFLETGHPMRLELSCKDAGITLTGETVEEAVNQPLTEEAAARVLKKTGKEPFYFEELNVKIRGSAFQTVGKLKELRRKGFARLGEQITGEYRREPVEKINKNVREMRSNSFCSPATIPLEAVVREPEQLKAVMEVPEAGRVFLPSEWEREELLQAFSEGKKAGKEMCLALPRMCREREQQFLEAEAAREDSLFVAADGFLISNMEAAAFLKAHGFFGKTPDCAVLDHSLYVFNREAAAFWNEQGFCRMTAPLELNAGELSLLDLSGSSVVLYGYMTLMISAQCVKDNRSGCTGIPETEEIRDGQKRKFYVRNHCRFCYNEILNGDPLWLGGQAGEIASLMPAALRFVFTIEGGKETKTILEAFIRGRKTERQVPYPGGRFFTKGHYARGVE